MHNPVPNALQSETGMLRRSLERAIADCTAALARMDEGQRPSLSMSGLVLGQTAQDVERHSATVNRLLDFAGSEILDAQFAMDTLKKKGI